jgi:hypothetical protein
MRAPTLTLDNDVAALLDRAHKEQGQSLEEMANELLRRTLQRLGAVSGSRRRGSQDSDDAVADIARLELAIDQVYDELRDLVARSGEDPRLTRELKGKHKQLHALQVEEAAALRCQAEARLHLKPGEGYRILERAERLLEQ